MSWMEPPADALLRNDEEFHDRESDALSQEVDDLTREQIIVGARADSERGDRCSIVILETDLNNSVRLRYARIMLEYSKKQMDQLADETIIGSSKATNFGALPITQAISREFGNRSRLNVQHLRNAGNTIGIPGEGLEAVF